MRHDLEVLEQYEEIMGEVQIPPPYPGWPGDGPGNPIPPVINSGNVPMYGDMPSAWGPLIEAHGLDPADFGGVGPIPFPSIPPPPLQVAVAVGTLGSILYGVNHLGTKVVGAAMIGVSGGLTIWILEYEEEDSD